MNAVCIHSLAPKELREMMDQYEKSARRDYELGSPRVDQLLTLIQRLPGAAQQYDHSRIYDGMARI
jgi:hypothetical protein